MDICTYFFLHLEGLTPGPLSKCVPEKICGKVVGWMNLSNGFRRSVFMASAVHPEKQKAFPISFRYIAVSIHEFLYSFFTEGEDHLSHRHIYYIWYRVYDSSFLLHGHLLSTPNLKERSICLMIAMIIDVTIMNYIFPDFPFRCRFSVHVFTARLSRGQTWRRRDLSNRFVALKSRNCSMNN